MLVVLREQLGPAGWTVELRITVPVNPLTEAIFISNLAVEPDRIATLAGLENKAKSRIFIVIVAVWVREPLEPVMITVKDPGSVPVQVRVEV